MSITFKNYILSQTEKLKAVILKCWYYVNMLRLHSHILQDVVWSLPSAVMHHDSALVVKVTPWKLITFVTYNNGNSTKSHHSVTSA